MQSINTLKWLLFILCLHFFTLLFQGGGTVEHRGVDKIDVTVYILNLNHKCRMHTFEIQLSLFCVCIDDDLLNNQSKWLKSQWLNAHGRRDKFIMLLQ